MTTATNEQSAHWGVLLLAHGAPDRLEDIPDFLLNVRGGRGLPEPAVQEIVRRYSLIGGGSPLLRCTQLQAQALARFLKGSVEDNGENPIPVYVGMRNWKPFIPEAVEKLAGDGINHVVALCLAPHNSRTSVGLYRRHLIEAIEKHAPRLQVEFIESWHDHPLLLAAFREKISRALDQAEEKAGRAVPVIFTAHSVPERTIAEGDAYDAQVKNTARSIAAAMSLPDWRLAYQSQGMTPEPWIGPTVESQIDELAAAGHRHVLIAPIGFVSDHVEILYDIDVAFRAYGEKRGLAIFRSESLNDSPLFIRALASIVVARIRSASSAGIR